MKVKDIIFIISSTEIYLLLGSRILITPTLEMENAYRSSALDPNIDVEDGKSIVQF